METLKIMKEFIDNWRARDFKCRHIGTYKGWNLYQGPLERNDCEVTCPNCGEVFGRLEFPPIAELRANLDRMTPENRAGAERFVTLGDDQNRWRLHHPDQLPDITAPHLVLLWDEDHDAKEVVVRFGEREIYRMPSSYEYCDFFIDACRVLKMKYGKALFDVIPTPRSYGNLWGDGFGAPDKCDGMRTLIQRATNFLGDHNPYGLTGIHRGPPKDTWKYWEPTACWKEDFFKRDP